MKLKTSNARKLPSDAFSAPDWKWYMYFMFPPLQLYALLVFLTAGVQKLSKHLDAIPVFLVSKEWQEASSTVRTHNSGVPCEPVIWRIILGVCELTHIFM